MWDHERDGEEEDGEGEKTWDDIDCLFTLESQSAKYTHKNVPRCTVFFVDFALLSWSKLSKQRPGKYSVGRRAEGE